MHAYQSTQLDALGDATRRAILAKLIAGPSPVGKLAEDFPKQARYLPAPSSAGERQTGGAHRFGVRMLAKALMEWPLPSEVSAVVHFDQHCTVAQGVERKRGGGWTSAPIPNDLRVAAEGFFCGKVFRVVSGPKTGEGIGFQ